jgi:hypothetical protein
VPLLLELETLANTRPQRVLQEEVLTHTVRIHVIKAEAVVAVHLNPVQVQPELVH